MADLTDLQAAQSVKIVGADSGGVETNPLEVTTKGARVDNSFASGSNTRPTVTTTTSAILASNANRKFAHIMNQSGKVVYLKFGDPAVANQGIRLANDGYYEINSTNLWTGAVNAIVASGTAVLDVFEGT